MATVWTSYGNQSSALNPLDASGNPVDLKLTPSIANECVDIMCGSSKTHAQEFQSIRDNINDLSAFLTKVNSSGLPLDPTSTAVKPLPQNFFNWMMVTLGRSDDDTKPNNNVALIYHLLRHRMTDSLIATGNAGSPFALDPTYGLWSVSIGIDKHYDLPKPDLNWKFDLANAQDYAYYKLAQDVSTRLKSDLLNLSPSGEYFVIMDHYDKSDDATAGGGAEPDPGTDKNGNRRKKKIAEFGYVLQQSLLHPAQLPLPFEIKNPVNDKPTRQPIPKGRDNLLIQSWAKNGTATKIVVTRIHVK